ncbi:UNC84B protein [Pelomyxa schiedti]|nr:UNC84B protein [Pelomyxa schiedti]
MSSSPMQSTPTRRQPVMGYGAQSPLSPSGLGRASPISNRAPTVGATQFPRGTLSPENVQAHSRLNSRIQQQTPASFPVPSSPAHPSPTRPGAGAWAATSKGAAIRKMVAGSPQFGQRRAGLLRARARCCGGTTWCCWIVAVVAACAPVAVLVASGTPPSSVPAALGYAALGAARVPVGLAGLAVDGFARGLRAAVGAGTGGAPAAGVGPDEEAAYAELQRRVGEMAWAVAQQRRQIDEMFAAQAQLHEEEYRGIQESLRKSEEQLLEAYSQQQQHDDATKSGGNFAARLQQLSHKLDSINSNLEKAASRHTVEEIVNSKLNPAYVSRKLEDLTQQAQRLDMFMATLKSLVQTRLPIAETQEVQELVNSVEPNARQLVSEVEQMSNTPDQNYALPSMGASIVVERTTPSATDNSGFLTKLFSPGKSAIVVLSPEASVPGNCWCFTGDNGYLTIQLGEEVKISRVAINHIPKSIAPNIQSAPNNCRIWASKTVNSGFDLLGEFNYDIDNEWQTTQNFPVQKDNTYSVVTLQILSNHGHPYTCLYSFQVYGTQQ